MRFLAVLIFSALIFSGAARSQPIGEADLLRHIKILASDAFEGREPGTVGENKTVNYIATQWALAGLRPAGEKGSWYAPVPLVERTPKSFGLFVANSGWGRAVRLQQSEIILRGRDRGFRQFKIPLVFAGYAEQGPEEQSVAGKFVLLPRTRSEDSDDSPSFRSRKLQLIRDGAVGVIAVIEDQERWPRFLRNFQRASTAVADPDNHAALEGAISRNQFGRLIQQAGLNVETLLADSAALSIVDLGLSADATAETQVRSYTSHNVIGKIPGTNPSSGAVLFMGHWDHLGLCRSEDPLDPSTDRICNGAVDNASGVSLLIETAHRLSGEDHDRDIYFLATTAEEKGLLGARAFIENLTAALEKFVVVFNVDTIALSDNGQKVAVVGLGEAGLDGDIATVAAQEGREIDRSGNADAYLRRQDGYVFLERNIPAYMITSAFADELRLKAFIDGPYHDVSDEANDTLVLTGAAADANFHVALGRYFSSTGTYPGKATSGYTHN